MLYDFKQHIENQNLFTPNNKILATVSGGVDSVVLCYLLKKNGYNFAIAHCNFKLRGSSSDEDEIFVKSLALNLNVDVFTTSFDTSSYSKEKKISTQMAARELRYTWFEHLKNEKSFDYILTAHHLNDNVETVLLNLVRGTSHRGLTGISSKSNGLIRPLLPFTKDQIKQFAIDNGIAWREDISNESNKYKRNLVRNKVIPLLEELNPNFIHTFDENIEKFNEESKILATVLSTTNGKTVLSIHEIKNSPSPLLTIWNWISPYGFTFSDAKDMFSSLEGSGKTFLSKDYRIIKDRGSFTLIEIVKSDSIDNIFIDKVGIFHFSNFTIELSESEIPDFSLGENTAFLNTKMLRFPLEIRRWKEGDKFQPLGMRGMKKVSDFLIDTKVPIQEKEKQLVLISNHKIAWLIGKRIDERFKSIGLMNYKIKFIE